MAMLVYQRVYDITNHLDPFLNTTLQMFCGWFNHQRYTQFPEASAERLTIIGRGYLFSKYGTVPRSYD